MKSFQIQLSSRNTRHTDRSTHSSEMGMRHGICEIRIELQFFIFFYCLLCWSFHWSSICMRHLLKLGQKSPKVFCRQFTETTNPKEQWKKMQKNQHKHNAEGKAGHNGMRMNETISVLRRCPLACIPNFNTEMEPQKRIQNKQKIKRGENWKANVEQKWMRKNSTESNRIWHWKFLRLFHNENNDSLTLYTSLNAYIFRIHSKRSVTLSFVSIVMLMVLFQKLTVYFSRHVDVPKSMQKCDDWKRLIVFMWSFFFFIYAGSIWSPHTSIRTTWFVFTHCYVRKFKQMDCIIFRTLEMHFIQIT